MGDEIRKCKQCGARLSMYNPTEVCQNHRQPKDYDPIGDRMRARGRALKYAGNVNLHCPVTRLKGDLGMPKVSHCMVSCELVPYHLDIKF